MKLKGVYIAFIVIFALLLLLSYVLFGNYYKNVDALWGRITGSLKMVYIISILLSSVAFILVFTYLVMKDNYRNNKEQLILFLLILGFFISSMFWMPLSFEYLKLKTKSKNNLTSLSTYSSSIIFTLFIVSMFVLGLMIYLIKLPFTNKEKPMRIVAIISCAYLFFHCFFFDFILWNYHFF